VQAALFVYDIMMVFGTKPLLGVGIMQDVALKIEGPILLMFPRGLHDGVMRFSKLGLGDICFPGAFISMLLRYDAFRGKVWRPPTDSLTPPELKELEALGKDEEAPPGLPGGLPRSLSFATPYFGAGMAFYVLALCVTIVVMLVFEHPQPALLYLSPACIIALFGTALVVGDVAGVLAYSEEDHPQPEEATKKQLEVEPQAETEEVSSPSNKDGDSVLPPAASQEEDDDSSPSKTRRRRRAE
jgi:minor histocompatibility antigen H13